MTDGLDGGFQTTVFRIYREPRLLSSARPQTGFLYKGSPSNVSPANVLVFGLDNTEC